MRIEVNHLMFYLELLHMIISINISFHVSLNIEKRDRVGYGYEGNLIFGNKRHTSPNREKIRCRSSSVVIGFSLHTNLNINIFNNQAGDR